LAIGGPRAVTRPAYLRTRAWALYVTIGWLLLSWYPHVGLHVHAGRNLRALLVIEYAFHVPLYLCTVGAQIGCATRPPFGDPAADSSDLTLTGI
jgi:hypothetical protein